MNEIDKLIQDYKYNSNIIEDDVEDLYQRSASTISDCYSNDEKDESDLNLLEKCFPYVKSVNEHALYNTTNDSNNNFYDFQNFKITNNANIQDSREEAEKKDKSFELMSSVSNFISNNKYREVESHKTHLSAVENNSNTDLMTKITRTSSPFYLETIEKPDSNRSFSVDLNEKNIVKMETANCQFTFQNQPITISETLSLKHSQYPIEFNNKHAKYYVVPRSAPKRSLDHKNMTIESKIKSISSESFVESEGSSFANNDYVTSLNLTNNNNEKIAHPPITKRSTKSPVISNIRHFTTHSQLEDINYLCGSTVETQTYTSIKKYREIAIGTDEFRIYQNEDNCRKRLCCRDLLFNQCNEKEIKNCLNYLTEQIRIITEPNKVKFEPLKLTQANDNNSTVLHNLSTNPIFSTNFITTLYDNLKDLCHKLHLKLRQDKNIPIKLHNRRFSDSFNYQNKTNYNNQDTAYDHILKIIKSSKFPTSKLELDGSQLFCRIFELGPYDELVTSYRNNHDRRIKAVVNKMKCFVALEGPLTNCDSTSLCWNNHSKVMFHCFVAGSSKDYVDKCIKCLQDTFPNSRLIEKTIPSFQMQNRQFITIPATILTEL